MTKNSKGFTQGALPKAGKLTGGTPLAKGGALPKAAKLPAKGSKDGGKK